MEYTFKKSSKKASVRPLPKLMNKSPMETIYSINKNDTKRIQSLKRHFPLITSGINFELMSMGIGVYLKEDDFLSKLKNFQ